VPTEITEAYNAMNTKGNDNLKQNELLKAMDAQIRVFCGVGPATQEEIDVAQDDEDDEEDKRSKRRNNRNSQNKDQRNRRPNRRNNNLD